jgi:hypothetical protein
MTMLTRLTVMAAISGKVDSMKNVFYPSWPLPSSEPLAALVLSQSSAHAAAAYMQCPRIIECFLAIIEL